MRTVWLAFFALLCVGGLIATKAGTGTSPPLVEAPVVQSTPAPSQAVTVVDTLTKTDKLSVAYVPEAIEDRPAPFSNAPADAELAPPIATASDISTEGRSRQTSSIKAEPKKPVSVTKPRIPTKKLKQNVARSRTAPEQKACIQPSNSFVDLLVALNLKSRCNA
ncbi:hypothetical protein SAMN05216374_5922 [Tardiphaga sp. OK246]|uniref:hypothetical protein n=1 Tax=Tardiphaga sp. OK246 TaxID=1855307 RepID=UPI000B70C8F4|nr:hypothetical protein [Tardiphaga sp. OK246]SNT61557.1 hypothetical protein SAMN05216374_5922 [Tardiphaga sp. OK246]